MAVTVQQTEIVPAEVVAAARRCFARFGVDRVTMEDIAKEAGIGRTGLYRLGLTRTQLSEAAILARASELVAALRPLMERDLPFAQALLEGSLAILDAARSDPELLHLISTCKAMELNTLLGGPNPIMHELAVGLMDPCFRRARERGEMREDITDQRAVVWLRGVYVMLLLRQDVPTEEERALIVEFLVPSLAKPGS